MTKRITYCTCDEDCPIHGLTVPERSDSLLVSRVLFYGKERFEPLNDQARRFATLLDQVLLTLEDVERIKALGYRIETKGEIL